MSAGIPRPQPPLCREDRGKGRWSDQWGQKDGLQISIGVANPYGGGIAATAMSRGADQAIMLRPPFEFAGSLVADTAGELVFGI